jgi:hypothetical protein
MELVLALVVLAAVIVAAAALFLANAARQRFDAHERQLGKVEEDAAMLKKGLREIKDAAQAEHQAVTQRAQQARVEIVQRHETDMRAQTERYGQAQETISDVQETVTQLRDKVSDAFQEQGAHLDSLIHHSADHDTRLDSLDQLTAANKSRLESLDRLVAGVVGSLDGLSADAARTKTEAGQQAAALRELSDDSASASERTAETMATLSEQLLALAADVGRLDLQHRELRSDLRKWLTFSAQLAKTSPVTRVIPGFINAERRAASQVLPRLYEALLRGVDLDFVFREHAGSAGVFYYLASRRANGQSAEQRLGNLLRACQNSDANMPGLAELRSLLLAMYVGGPGTTRLGPLFVSYSAEGRFRGIVLTDGEAETLDTGDLTSSPIRCVMLLSELPEDRVLDLASWAVSNS